MTEYALERIPRSVAWEAELGSLTALRTLYAFDPLRVAILLVGGDKTGDDRWYEASVALADRIYDQHLRELRKEDKL